MASRLTVHHNRELPLDRKLVIDVRYEDLSPEIYDQFNTARAEDSTGLLTEFLYDYERQERRAETDSGWYAYGLLASAVGATQCLYTSCSVSWNRNQD